MVVSEEGASRRPPGNRARTEGHGQHVAHAPDGVATTARSDPASGDGFEAVLRAAGHRVTEPRRAVHAALRDSAGHVTAEEVVAASGGDVNLATVYRVLGLLEELGLARSARLGPDGSASWELAHPDDHFHLVCTRCGDVDHHVGDAVDHPRTPLRAGPGFLAAVVDLVVRGLCASCRGVADEVVPPSRPADEARDVVSSQRGR